ncbi:recombinase family protein [Thalassolituus sp.]|uniref:recombinase family protein n=1 Tax=Thalassolituus sp. TaxID=2030822 RepID=UPI0032D8C49D
MTQLPTTKLPNALHGQKAIIYCRVSSLRQTIDGSGLDSQEHRCRRYAEQHGYVVEKVFTDDVSGGGDFLKRKGMVALLDYLRRRKTHYVVIFDDLKRFARDTLFHLQLRAQMDRYNARIECLNFRFEDTPEGKFVEIIHAAQGQLEREQNGRQTIQKMCARLEQGYFVFQAPIGYCYEKIGAHGKLLVQNEPYASVIKESLEGFASGRFQTQAEMRRYLESCECIPKNAKGQIAKKRTMDLLKHPVYAGYVEHERWGISFRKGQHEPLISLETYRKNQERLNGKPLVPNRKDLNKEFPLRGFVVCGDCGHPYTACFSKGKTKYHPYYICQKRGCASYGKSVRRADLEGAFERVLRHMTPSKDVLNLALAMLKDQWHNRENLQGSDQKEQKKALAETEHKIEKVIDMMIDANSEMVKQNLTKRLAQLEKDKLILEEKLATVTKPRRPLESIARTSLDFLESPHKIWASERLEDKRAVLKLAFTKPWAYHRIEGARTPDFSLPFKALEEISGANNQMVPKERLELSRA